MCSAEAPVDYCEVPILPDRGRADIEMRHILAAV